MVDIQKLMGDGRISSFAEQNDPELGLFDILAGTWESANMGWNMIALPDGTSPMGYRLLLNQYKETLSFSKKLIGIPNRGLKHDQGLIGLDYEQVIHQVAVTDFPPSDHRGAVKGPKSEIHHEPGLFLQMGAHFEKPFNLARLANIPHGNSVLALGFAEEKIQGRPDIPFERGLPIGVPESDLQYLEPYLFFQNDPFEGTDLTDGVAFDPTRPNELLDKANKGKDFLWHRRYHFDTEFKDSEDRVTGGILNIPFIEKEADATEMRSTFWVSKIKGEEALHLQYSQTVMLDFFEARDGSSRKIKWPHVSINTLRKVEDQALEPDPA